MTIVKAVIFDHGGVLTEGGEKGTIEKAISKAMGLDFIVEIPDLIDGLKRGKLTNEHFVDLVNEGLPYAPRKLTSNLWNDIFGSLQLDASAYQFVERCRQAGLRVGLLSNINFTIAKMLREHRAYDRFDPLVLSCYTGFAKPDSQIYSLVETELRGIRPAETLLLDDQAKCINAASARGWQTLLVTSPGQMVQEASRLLGF